MRYFCIVPCYRCISAEIDVTLHSSSSVAGTARYTVQCTNCGSTMVGPPRVGDERAVEAALGRWRTANETLANPVLARDALNGIVKALKTYEEYGDEQGAGIPAQAPRWLVILCAAIFATLVIGAIVWRLYANR